MDNVTHSLTALALGRAGLNRLYAKPLLVLVVAANLPDLDIVPALFLGQLGYLEIHRHITHSLVLLPVWALFPMLLGVALSRSFKGWKSAYLLAALGIASHLLLDWTNSYAVRLLSPISETWFHADINNVFDVWILAVLIVAALAPLLGKLVSGEIGAKPGTGQGLAIFALIFFAGFDFARYLLHERAIATMSSHVYDGQDPRQVAAFPTAANPWRWDGWVETGDSAIQFDINLMHAFNPTGGRRFFKPESSPAIEAAKKTREFQVFSRFTLYPLLMSAPADQPEGATRVELRDERFPFAAEAVVDRSNRVIRSSFHF